MNRLTRKRKQTIKQMAGLRRPKNVSNLQTLKQTKLINISTNVTVLLQGMFPASVAVFQIHFQSSSHQSHSNKVCTLLKCQDWFLSHVQMSYQLTFCTVTYCCIIQLSAVTAQTRPWFHYLNHNKSKVFCFAPFQIRE